MNRLFFLTFVTCMVLTGCINNTPNQLASQCELENDVQCDKTHSQEVSTSDKVKQENLPLVKFALRCYKAYPNFDNNSETRIEAKKFFKKEFIEKVNNDSLLNNIPMQLRTIKRLNGKYIAHFWSSHSCLSREVMGPFEEISFDYAVTIPHDIAMNLKEQDNYLLSVSYISHIDNISTFQHMVGYNDWVLTDEIGIVSNKYDATRYSVNLGMMLVDFISIKPFPKSHKY